MGVCWNKASDCSAYLHLTAKAKKRIRPFQDVLRYMLEGNMCAQAQRSESHPTLLICGLVCSGRAADLAHN